MIPKRKIFPSYTTIIAQQAGKVNQNASDVLRNLLFRPKNRHSRSCRNVCFCLCYTREPCRLHIGTAGSAAVCCSVTALFRHAPP